MMLDMARAATTADAFNAVAEPRRRQILDVLAAGERPVGELVDVLGLAQPQVSKHLRVLREVGAVDVRDEGRRRLYRVNGRRAQADPRLGPRLRGRMGRALRRVGRGPRRPQAKEQDDGGDDEHSAKVTLPTDEQILIVREFDAPRAARLPRVHRAGAGRRWWPGKRGEMTTAEIDLRVGGAWRYAMIAEGGFEVAFHGEFREIVPSERIVHTEVYEGAPPGTGPALVTVELAEDAGRTRLQMLMELEDRETRDAIIESGMEGGLQEGLDILEQIAVELR